LQPRLGTWRWLRTSYQVIHNPFTVLNSTPNAILHKVLMDLELESENLDEHIDAFKAEEIARAAIAEANYKCFLEKQLEKTCPRDDEQI